ncbi:hypothetical protein KY284_028383 [Solanum tuberosum]|nr:hypothetical protein KY284_028383 [Solanum tuberosum]
MEQSVTGADYELKRRGVYAKQIGIQDSELDEEERRKNGKAFISIAINGIDRIDRYETLPCKLLATMHLKKEERRGESRVRI